MTRRRLAALIGGLLLGAQLGTLQVAATPTLDQLATMSEILAANDVAGLRAFVEVNPDLLAGEDTIALLLRRFMEESRDIARFIAITPDLGDVFTLLSPPVVDAPVPVTPSPEPVTPAPVTPAPVDPTPVTPPVEEGSDPGDDPPYR